MADRIQIRRDSTNNWESANPVLGDGEMGFDTTANNFKIGDGVTTWCNIDYHKVSVEIPPPTHIGPKFTQGKCLLPTVHSPNTVQYNNSNYPYRKNIDSFWLHTDGYWYYLVRVPSNNQSDSSIVFDLHVYRTKDFLEREHVLRAIDRGVGAENTTDMAICLTANGNIIIQHGAYIYWYIKEPQPPYNYTMYFLNLNGTLNMALPGNGTQYISLSCFNNTVGIACYRTDNNNYMLPIYVELEHNGTSVQVKKWNYLLQTSFSSTNPTPYSKATFLRYNNNGIPIILCGMTCYANSRNAYVVYWDSVTQSFKKWECGGSYYYDMTLDDADNNIVYYSPDNSGSTYKKMTLNNGTITSVGSIAARMAHCVNGRIYVIYGVNFNALNSSELYSYIYTAYKTTNFSYVPMCVLQSTNTTYQNPDSNRNSPYLFPQGIMALTPYNRQYTDKLYHLVLDVFGQCYMEEVNVSTL